MKRKVLSLLLAICCAAACAAFPALGAQPEVSTLSTETYTTVFSDTFTDDTEGEAPANWRTYAGSLEDATLTVAKESDNHFLRLQAAAASSIGSAIAATRENVVNIPFEGQLVKVSLKMRSSHVTDTISSVRLGYPEYESDGSTPNSDYGANNYSLFAARASLLYISRAPWTAGTQDAITATSLAWEAGTWYTVTAVLDTLTGQVEYTLNGSTATGTIANNMTDLKAVIDNVTLKLQFPAAGAYIDIDDVEIACREREAIAFHDDFESENDETPDNWEMYDAYSYGALSVVTDTDSNKHLRMTVSQDIEGYANAARALVKRGKLFMPMKSSSQPFAVSMKIRVSDMSAAATRYGVVAAYPTPRVKKTYSYSDAHMLHSFRTGNIKYMSTEGSYSQTYYPTASGLTIETGKWYETKVIVNPADDSLLFAFTAEDGTTITATGTMAETDLTAVSLLDNIGITITDGATGGSYLDLDDVSVDYIPRSFADDFEGETLNAAPSNWVDKGNVATLTVLEDETAAGNQYLRITTAAGESSSVSMMNVTNKLGTLRIPYTGNSKGIAVAAKIRVQNANYRAVLAVNADTYYNTYGLNHWTLMCLFQDPLYQYYLLSHETTVGSNRQWALSAVNDAAAENTWVDYKAILLPGTKTILHYIDGKLVAEGSLDNEELNAADLLQSIHFCFRSPSTLAGTLDVDDVSIYEIDPAALPPYTVYKSGAIDQKRLVSMQTGDVMATAKMPAGSGGQAAMVVHALYTKAGDSWLLTEADTTTHTFTAGDAGVTSTLTVTDAENQIIRSFIWADGTFMPLTEAFQLLAAQ